MTLEKNCQRRYFNPLPPHGGRPAAASYLPPHEGISIHSLRMEGDRYAVCGNVAAANFNPLPPHGGRLSPDVLYPETLGFQSTPSAWRETCRHRSLHRNQSHFNPLPPHGGRPISSEPTAATISFQSTPSAWRETETVVPPFPSTKFQSTPSAWRETDTLPYIIDIKNISIHSLRMEGDEHT